MAYDVTVDDLTMHQVKKKMPLKLDCQRIQMFGSLILLMQDYDPDVGNSAPRSLNFVSR